MSAGPRELVLTGLEARMRGVFEANLAGGIELGAAVSVWCDGEEVVSLAGGWRDAARTEPWDAETLVLIWSATKGVASACVLHALEKRGVPLDARVAEFWPEFGRAGKESLTVGQVLSHRAGLSALDDTNLSILDHEAVVRAIERQVPQWPAGAGHGYGPRTFGFVVDEMVRRLSDGMPLAAYFRKFFGDPLGLDLWIGLPAEHHGRVAQMIAPRLGVGAGMEDAFARAMGDAQSLTRRAFASPPGLAGVSAMNASAVRGAALPSLGGIGTASALGKFYAFLAGGGYFKGQRLFGPVMTGWMSRTLAQGHDQVLQVETAFSAGFMRDPVDADGRKVRAMFGPSLQAFGHPGAGGSLAFADPEAGVGFAYVMNQMEAGVLPKRRALDLVEALYTS